MRTGFYGCSMYDDKHVFPDVAVVFLLVALCQSYADNKGHVGKVLLIRLCKLSHLLSQYAVCSCHTLFWFLIAIRTLLEKEFELASFLTKESKIRVMEATGLQGDQVHAFTLPPSTL